MSHRTLVDEFWNDSRLGSEVEGKPSYPQNEARKFREDCHRDYRHSWRHAGWCITRPTVSFRPHGSSRLARSRISRVRVREGRAQDGKSFEHLELVKQDSSEEPRTARRAYGFWYAFECHTGPLPTERQRS